MYILELISILRWCAVKNHSNNRQIKGDEMLLVRSGFHQTAVSESTLSGDELSGRMTSSSSSDAIPGSNTVSKTSTDSVNALPSEATAICVGASVSEMGLSLGSDEMTTCSVASDTFEESVVSSSSGRRRASSPASSSETRSLQKESPFEGKNSLYRYLLFAIFLPWK